MPDECKTKTLSNVIVQENGIIRRDDGYAIGRLSIDTDFNSLDGAKMNEIKKLMQVDTFTSREFNKKLNATLEHGWNSKVTLDFLYVAESLGMVECLGQVAGNQYSWKITR